MIQGFLVSSVIAGALFAVFFLGYTYGNEFQSEFAAFIFIPMVLIGTLLGFLGTRIYTLRFRKLFLIGLFLVYLVSLAYAAFMILGDKSSMIKGAEIVTSILMLGSTGFLLFGIFTIPLLLLAVFLIELWTHPEY